MADLDTRSKRASSVGILVVSTLSLVLPDGTIDQGDRQHTAFSYSGIAAAAAVVADIYHWPVWITAQARPTFTVQAKPIFTVQAKPTFTRS